MKQELLNVLVWAGAFLFLELPSKDVWGLWPWNSLSRTVWIGEAWWWPIAGYVAVFMAVLLGHLEFDWSASWLVILGIIGAVGILIHIFAK